MGLEDLTRDGVRAAVEECRRMGREEFLAKYGYRRANRYELVLDGERYDSKAIAGVGHMHSTGTLLTARDFSGGANTVARRLRALHFTVEDATTAPAAPEPDGPQLILQPRGGARDRGPQNFVKSVRQGVALEELEEVLGEQAKLLRSLYPDGIIRLWGSTPTSQANNEKAKALRGRRAGDHVLFYAKMHFIARARVLHLFDSPHVAEAVWGSDEGGATWEHIMALGDVEEFSTPVPAAPLLEALDVRPRPQLRSLTLRSAHDYRRVTSLLPETQTTSSPAPTEPSTTSARTLTTAELLRRLGSLHTHRNAEAGAPSRHQPLTLLWAMSRVAAGEPRLAPWSRFRSEVGALLGDFGLPHSRNTPEYPFWHLRRSGLWEVRGIPDDAVAMPQTGVFNDLQPTAGLTGPAAELLQDPVVLLDAVATLCGTYLEDVDRFALLDRIGLGGYANADGRPHAPEGDEADEAEHRPLDAERVSGPVARLKSTSSRLVRDRGLSKWVKELHDHHCQICRIHLRCSRGSYVQAAHIRGLGSPHDGPDESSNVLCLCPNHHALFDGLEIYIDEDYVVKWTHDDEPLGSLHRHPRHSVDEEHIRYHRTLCKLTA